MNALVIIDEDALMLYIWGVFIAVMDKMYRLWLILLNS